ncbi:MAG: primosomal protein [Rickettsiaceae bacterium]|nr:primosomal protein [Rickettsiaceae bacterium]
MKTIQVLIPLSLPSTLTYSLPDGLDAKPGDFVEVPIGNKKAIGVLWDNSQNQENSTIQAAKIKPIYSRLPAPPLQESVRKLIDWVADYTMSPPGNVLKMCMSVPEALQPEKLIEAYELVGIKNQESGIKMTPSRQAVIELFNHDSDLKLTSAQIIEQTGVGASVIKSLSAIGAIKKVQITPPVPEIKIKDFEIDFSPQQQLAAADLCKKIHSGYSTTVLDGVTGSGKTEVYFAAVAEVLKGIRDSVVPDSRFQIPDSNAQVLILLPEIALTTQIVSRFENAFGFTPTQWHSGLTSKQREKNWRDISAGRARLIIGARSALFLPYQALSLIVVDEEHDGSYKQEEGVIYQARDMAVVRANIEKIPVILASATPSIETVENIKAGKYSRVHLISRYGEAVMPDIKIVDMRREKLKSGMWLSAFLKKELTSNISSGKQSMLFLNRRGYAPLTLCRECGHRFKCPDCISWLVEHKNPRRLLCHHCGYNEPVPTICPECNKEGMLVSCGPGVERVAEEVEQAFPNARVLLMTSDKMTSLNQAGTMIENITDGNVDIIIGTQIMAKGYHFPNLTLVGVIDADLGLEGGDLRAAERTYQLLQQVAGRAGRAKQKGTVIMQSYMPENMVMQSLASGSRDEFIQTESTSRKLTNMPPYSRLAGVIVSGRNDKEVFMAARAIVAASPLQQSVRVMGPVPAPLFLLRGKYRYRILVQSPRNINIQGLLRSLLAKVKIPPSVKVKVDIDPYSFM